MTSLSLTNLKGAAKDVAIAARFLDDFSPCTDAEQYLDKIMPAASVIKLGIMSFLLSQASADLISLQEQLLIGEEDFVLGAGVIFELEPQRSYSLAELCRLMIVVSDNTASNALIKRLGMQNLNEFWDNCGYQARLNRLFMHPTIDGKDNHMSALAAAKMLQDLYQGKNLTDKLKAFAISTLRRQQYREKIPLMLPESVRIGHKTGELDRVRHDAAVVEAERPYILVILTSLGLEPWLVDRAIAEFSLSLYDKLNQNPDSQGN